MVEMELRYFTDDEDFPFFIQYGQHDEALFVHTHKDFCEMTIVLEGKAVHVVNGERFDIGAGDVFVMGSGIAHGYDCTDGLRICNVMFRPESLLAADYDVKQSAGFHALFLLEPHYNTAQGFQSRLRLSQESFPRIRSLIDETISEYASSLPGRRTLLLAYFMQLIVELSRVYTLCEGQKRHKEIDSIAGAAAYMESNYMNDIRADELLDVSHYSQRHFIRLFSEIYHLTPQKYLLSIRMRHACSLLRESSLLVTEVATRCGFNDPNYFSRSFRKFIGATPNEFRKR